MRKTKKPTPGWKTAFGIKKSTVAADKLWDMFCTQHRPVIAEASKRLESVRQSLVPLGSLDSRHAAAIVRHLAEPANAETLLRLLGNSGRRAGAAELPPSPAPATAKTAPRKVQAKKDASASKLAAKAKAKKSAGRKKANWRDRLPANSLSYAAHINLVAKHLAPHATDGSVVVRCGDITRELGGPAAGIRSDLVGLAIANALTGVKKERYTGPGAKTTSRQFRIVGPVGPRRPLPEAEPAGEAAPPAA